jgi:hypothetical protein
VSDVGHRKLQMMLVSGPIIRSTYLDFSSNRISSQLILCNYLVLPKPSFTSFNPKTSQVLLHSCDSHQGANPWRPPSPGGGIMPSGMDSLRSLDHHLPPAQSSGQSGQGTVQLPRVR